MAEKDFHVSLPEEVVGGCGWNDSEVPRRVREALVMELLRLDRLSEAQAATVLGCARWELLDLMGRYDVPAVRMNAEELDVDIRARRRRSREIRQLPRQPVAHLRPGLPFLGAILLRERAEAANRVEVEVYAGCHRQPSVKLGRTRDVGFGHPPAAGGASARILSLKFTNGPDLGIRERALTGSLT